MARRHSPLWATGLYLPLQGRALMSLNTLSPQYIHSSNTSTFWVYIGLSIVTLGAYPLYFYGSRQTEIIRLLSEIDRKLDS